LSACIRKFFQNSEVCLVSLNNTVFSSSQVCFPVPGLGVDSCVTASLCASAKPHRDKAVTARGNIIRIATAKSRFPDVELAVSFEAIHLYSICNKHRRQRQSIRSTM
jgi:hypothetical protein